MLAPAEFRSLRTSLPPARTARCTGVRPENSNVFLERFSFECRKVIGFAITTLRDWLIRFAPLFHPITSKTKTNFVIASRALHQLHVITSSFDWFTVLSVSIVIS